MSSWAYACTPCRGQGQWWVGCPRVDEMPPSVTILRVRVDDDWLCARVDRGRRVAVDGALLREAVASGEADCPECAVHEGPPPPPPPASASDGPGLQVQAAAVALAGRRFIVVLVPLEVVRSPGEAAMAAADLAPRFGGVELVLMGQTDDGTPEYHGAAESLALLQDVPLERMPWKTYTLR